MKPTYEKALNELLAKLSKDDGINSFTAKFLALIIEAKKDLGEPISPSSLNEDLHNVNALRDRYLDSRWSCPIGHNETLSQLERISRRYSQEYINRLATSLWQNLSKLDKD